MSGIEPQELNEASEKNTIESFVSQNRVSKQRLQACLGRVDLFPERCGRRRCLVLFTSVTATASSSVALFINTARLISKALIRRRTVLGRGSQIAVAARNAGAPAVRPPLFVQRNLRVRWRQQGAHKNGGMKCERNTVMEEYWRANEEMH